MRTTEETLVPQYSIWPEKKVIWGRFLFVNQLDFVCWSLYPVLPRILLARCAVDVFVGDLFMFRFKAKENLQRCGDVFIHILITSKGASALGMF